MVEIQGVVGVVGEPLWEKWPITSLYIFKFLVKISVGQRSRWSYGLEWHAYHFCQRNPNLRLFEILIALLQQQQADACPVKMWLSKLTALDMTPMGWLGRKTSPQTNNQKWSQSGLEWYVYHSLSDNGFMVLMVCVPHAAKNERLSEVGITTVTITTIRTRGPRWPCIAHLIIRQVWVNWLFGSREEVQYWFSRWRPSWISNQNDWATFDLQVISIIPMKFESIALLVGEKMLLGQPSWISDHNDFSYFLSWSYCPL